MFKFIRYFIMGWQNYPGYEAWRAEFAEKHPREYAEMCETDTKRGVKPEYGSRFEYAWRNARIYYAHRDKYGRKCRKFGGDCERCTAKHC